MKTGKNYLIWAVFIGIFCVPTLGKVELSNSDKKLLSPGPAYRGLSGIDVIHVAILLSDSKVHKNLRICEGLKTKVENMLGKEGIRPVRTRDDEDISRSFELPELRICIDTLTLEYSKQLVFRIQTSLCRMVYVAIKENGLSPLKPKFMLKADIWKKGSPLQVVPAKDMPAALTDVVIEQAEAFIAAYRLANPRTGQLLDTQQTSTVSSTIQNTSSKPPAQQPVADYYVASKYSKVFHRPDCSWALRIKPKNKVIYRSKDDAIRDGRRPCKVCKP